MTFLQLFARIMLLVKVVISWTANLHVFFLTDFPVAVRLRHFGSCWKFLDMVHESVGFPDSNLFVMVKKVKEKYLL